MPVDHRISIITPHDDHISVCWTA